MIKSIGSAGLMVGVLAGLFTGIAQAEVKEQPTRSYTITARYELADTPGAVFEAATGDISGWWDHRFTPDPARFFIDARPGGGFYEWFDVDGKEGVKHADVIFAKRGERLTFVGPLGFNGKAMDIVVTYLMKPSGDAATALEVQVAVSGQDGDGWADAIAGVWDHFIGDRLVPYVAAGCHRDKKAPCTAFD